MSVQDEFAAFIRGLQPRLKTQVGALVEDNLADAMRLAARMELWSGDTTGSGSGGGQKKDQGGKGGGKGNRSGGQEPKKKGYVQATEDSVDFVKGKGKKQGQQKGRQQGSQNQGQTKGKPPCFSCGGLHFMKDCPEWKAACHACPWLQGSMQCMSCLAEEKERPRKLRSWTPTPIHSGVQEETLSDAGGGSARRKETRGKQKQKFCSRIWERQDLLILPELTLCVRKQSLAGAPVRNRGYPQIQFLWWGKN